MMQQAPTLESPGQPTLVYAADLAGKIAPPPGGINIVGGIVELDGTRWLLKFVGRAEATAQAMADAIKPLFAGADGEPEVSPRIGVSVRELADAYCDRLAVVRGAGPRDASGRVMHQVNFARGKPVLLLRFLDGLQAMRAAAVPAELRRRWIPVLALRLLVMSARDPWGNIQWMPATERFVSFDEGTAFGAEMAPQSEQRAAYLGKTPKVTPAFRAELAAAAPLIAELQARWLAEVSEEKLLAVLAGYADAPRVAAFVRANLASLPADWAVLFGTPPPAAPAPAAAGAAFVDPPRTERAYNQRPFMGGLTVAAERSRLQKAARRGLGEEARYAVAAMLGSQNFTNALRRLATMVVEDVCSPAAVVWAARPIGRLLLLQQAAIARAKDGWRDLRNNGEVRALFASLASYLAAAPASRMHDHVAGALFKDDHPFCVDSESPVPVRSAASREEAPARIRQLLGELRAVWSEAGERELLYLLGGMWAVLRGAPHVRRGELVPPGHARWLFGELMFRSMGDARMQRVVASLQTMFEELNVANAAKGKLFVIAAAVFWARSGAGVPAEHALCWEPLDEPMLEAGAAEAEYRRLIAGEWRIPVHDWVFDLHAGNGRDSKVAFYHREQAALVNCAPAADPWFAECAALAAGRLERSGDRRGKRVCA